jgi:capsular exopolysaccharide synthesis family protein
MSRYYNQVRKDQFGVSEATPTNGAQLHEVDDTVQEVEREPGKVNFDRFRECQKVTLAPHATYPVLLDAESLGAAATDSYRVLRTRLVRQMGIKGLRSVVVSSANPSEGKTLTTMNLGLACAKLPGQKVLLIDADLRNRGLSRLLGANELPGLFEVLAGEIAIESAVISTNIPNLSILTAGQGSERFPEAFAGERWKELMGSLSESFKTILVDAPPIIPLADSDLIATGCDGVLLVVRALKTNRELLRKAVKQLDAKKLLGVVFNDTKALDGYSYYGTGYD